MKIAIVMTTIHDGHMLEEYCQQAQKEGKSKDLRAIVIGDQKTPVDLWSICEKLRRKGFDIVCPTLVEQETYLGRFNSLSRLVPWNSDNRRNIGFLMALEWGCDVMVSLDDDNFCPDNPHTFEEYGVVCGDVRMPSVESENGWYNLCDMLALEPSVRVYPRGFPYHKRHQNPKIELREEAGTVRMNAGLWLEEPDLDAITWMVVPVRAMSFKGTSVLLGAKTWAPINSQNTSLHRDVIPSYYFIRMGYPLAGTPIDRYGDILSGYFSQACVRHMKHRIRVGTPVAFHRRNAHNYLRDTTQELAGLWLLEELTQWLPEARLQGNTYSESFLSLADALEDQVERFQGFIWTDPAKAYFHQMAYCMRQWIQACRKIS